MTTLRKIIGLALLVALPEVLSAAKVTPDLLPPQRRQATVILAEKLAERNPPAALPSDLVSPFDFEKVEAPEPAPRPGTVAGPATDSRPVPPPAPLGPKQILEQLATQLNPTGVIEVAGKPLLLMGVKRFEVGTRFTVTYNGDDHELELVAIGRTTFTLRYRGEEIIRPIKSVR